MALKGQSTEDLVGLAFFTGLPFTAHFSSVAPNITHATSLVNVGRDIGRL